MMGDYVLDNAVTLAANRRSSEWRPAARSRRASPARVHQVVDGSARYAHIGHEAGLRRKLWSGISEQHGVLPAHPALVGVGDRPVYHLHVAAVATPAYVARHPWEAALRAGVQERYIRLAEQYGETIGKLLEQV